MSASWDLTVGEVIAAEAVHLGRLDQIGPEAQPAVVTGVGLLLSRDLARMRDDGTAALDEGLAGALGAFSGRPVLVASRNDGHDPVETWQLYAVADGAVTLQSAGSHRIQIDRLSLDQVAVLLGALADEAAEPLRTAVDGAPVTARARTFEDVEQSGLDLEWPLDWESPVVHTVAAPPKGDIFTWVAVDGAPWVVSTSETPGAVTLTPASPDGVRHGVAAVLASLNAGSVR